MKALALNSEGTLVATGSHDRTLQVWQVNPENGTYHVTSYAGHAGGVWALALSPDGTMLSSSDDKGVTLLWDVSTDSLAERVPGRLSSDRPYERMNIYGINGLNEAQRAALRALGAVEDEESALAGRQTAGGRPALVLLGPDEGSEPPARQSR
jgi:hypothetical protein